MNPSDWERREESYVLHHEADRLRIGGFQPISRVTAQQSRMTWRLRLNQPAVRSNAFSLLHVGSVSWVDSTSSGEQRCKGGGYRLATRPSITEPTKQSKSHWAEVLEFKGCLLGCRLDENNMTLKLCIWFRYYTTVNMWCRDSCEIHFLASRSLAGSVSPARHHPMPDSALLLDHPHQAARHRIDCKNHG
jgi:hypothetical protein